MVTFHGAEVLAEFVCESASSVHSMYIARLFYR